MELSCFNFALHGISFYFFSSFIYFLLFSSGEFVIKTVSFAMDYKVLSPQFFLSFVFITRFMNFSSFKEGKNHSFRPILYSCSRREIRWALFMGLKMAFHDDCLALWCFFSLSKFECKNVLKIFYECFCTECLLSYFMKRISIDNFLVEWFDPFELSFMSTWSCHGWWVEIYFLVGIEPKAVKFLLIGSTWKINYVYWIKLADVY